MTAAAAATPRAFTGDDIRTALTPRIARRSIEKVLAEGFRPDTDPTRSNIAAGAGHLLLMPSTIGAWTGVKVAAVAPGNPELGLPRIQASYLLMDSRSLSVQATMDGIALTSLRTPAVSAVAADYLAAPDASRLVVFGAGPQAVEHTVAMADVRELQSIRIVGRRPERVQAAIDQLRARGINSEAGTADDVAEADIIVCATSAKDALFDGALVRDGACVVAIGSHEPDRRELDAGLIGRALVVVEDAQTALREAGDVIQAVDTGHLDAATLVGIDAIVRGETPRSTDRPNVFKGVGMSWQDLAAAIAVMEG